MGHCIGLGGGVEGAAHGAVVVEEGRHGGGGGLLKLHKLHTSAAIYNPGDFDATLLLLQHSKSVPILSLRRPTL